MKTLDLLIEKYPDLIVCREEIIRSYEILLKAYTDGNKVLVCGNGGSASDSEHIVGELMKGFKMERSYHSEALSGLRLQRALPAISLVSQFSLISAISNDNGADLIYAQQVLGYGKQKDVLIALSTSGNSKNVILAAKLAKELGLEVISLTGEGGGLLKDLSSSCIAVPAKETYLIQEYHLPIYHALCAMLEEHFFS